MKITSGKNLYKFAKKIIPGGTTLFSKRSELHLPDNWPAYFSKGKGTFVWDLKGKKYLDMFCAVGTNVLGYANNAVNKSVLNKINKSNMTTLNCPEEVYLANNIISHHPWASMAKFTRGGGEANAVAIRIARSNTKKKNIAFCGYHGWHDWYLSTNLNSIKNNNLNTHLMKDLNIKGVPKKLKNTVFSFQYGDYQSLENLVKKKNIGVIKMEVCRNTEPNINFLKKVRNLASINKIILIFDECTTGFRETYGGLHKKIKIYPDISIFGKTLGNGYAITAIIGKRDIMECANNSFISSTFWTERIGPTAALKTIEVMKNIKSWQTINKIGNKIRKRWDEMFKFYKLRVNINGISSLSNFIFESKNHQSYKTLITQEMLKKNFLSTNTIYPCIKHSDNLIDMYFDHLEIVIKTISDCENNGQDIKKYLESDISLKDFKRYN